MSVRNCEELGIILQKIVKRLMVNEDLIKLLYYQDKDPLSNPSLTEEEKQTEIFNKLLKIVPKVISEEESRSAIAIYVTQGVLDTENPEFVNVHLCIDVFTPLTSWIIKDSNFRPFAIMGQIQKTLSGKTIDGLGKLRFSNFQLSKLTQENSIYTLEFNVLNYA